jgi:hypothetical protein
MTYESSSAIRDAALFLNKELRPLSPVQLMSFVQSPAGAISPRLTPGGEELIQHAIQEQNRKGRYEESCRSEFAADHR